GLRVALSPDYRVERELGGGGMSRVFLAEETELGRRVVIKILPPEMGVGVSIDRFRPEIQLAAALQHPHIVPLLHAGHVEEVLYYTMPLIGGESLRAKLAREGALPIADTVRILRDVVDALAYAHRHDVAHRDIKPDNVLISDHHAVVTDFGVAKALGEGTGGSPPTICCTSWRRWRRRAAGRNPCRRQLPAHHPAGGRASLCTPASPCSASRRSPESPSSLAATGTLVRISGSCCWCCPFRTWAALTTTISRTG